MQLPRYARPYRPIGTPRRSSFLASRWAPFPAVFFLLAALAAAYCPAQPDSEKSRPEKSVTAEPAPHSASPSAKPDAGEAKAARPRSEPTSRAGAEAEKGDTDGGAPTKPRPGAKTKSPSEAAKPRPAARRPTSEIDPDHTARERPDRPGTTRPAESPSTATPAADSASTEVTSEDTPAGATGSLSPLLPLAGAAGATAAISGAAAAEEAPEGAAPQEATTAAATGAEAAESSTATTSRETGTTDRGPSRPTPAAEKASRLARDDQVTRFLEQLTSEAPAEPMTAADRLALVATLSRQARMQTAAMQAERARYQESLDDAVRLAAEFGKQERRLPGLLVTGGLPLAYLAEARDRADETVAQMGTLFDEALERRAELTRELVTYGQDVTAARAASRTWRTGDLATAMQSAVGVLEKRAATARELATLLDDTIAQTVEVSEAAGNLSLDLTAGLRTRRSRSLMARTTKPLTLGTAAEIGVEMRSLAEQATGGLLNAGERISAVNPWLAAALSALLLGLLVALWWALPRLAEGFAKEARDRGLAEGVTRLSRLMVPGGRALLLMGFVSLTARTWHLPEDWEMAAVAYIGAWMLYVILLYVLRELLAPGAPERRVLPLGDEAAGNLFRVLRSAALYTVVLYPVLVLLGQGSEPPAETLRALQFIFPVGLLALLLVMTRGSGGLLAVLPAPDTPRSTATQRMGRIVVPVAALGIAASAVAAAGGYTNLAAHISRILSLEVVLLACAVFVDHLILRAPGVSTSRWQRPLTGAFWTGIVLAQIPIFRLHSHHAGIAYDLLKTPFITVQGAEVSGASILKALVLVMVAYVIARFVRTQLQSSDYLSSRMQSGAAYALANLAFYVVITVGALWSIVAAGFQLSVLTVFAGMAGIGLGFGLQDVVGNFVSGLILLIERPVAVGDYVEVDTLRGHITAINLRSTTIRTRDNNIVLLPNSDLAGSRVTNLTLGDPMVRVNVAVGVSYSTDMDLVHRVLRQCVEQDDRFFAEPEPRIVIVGFGNSSVDWEVWASVATPEEAIRAAPDLRKRIWDAFAEHGIEIPFPQTDLHIRSSDIPLPYGGAEDGQTPPAG